MGQWIGSSFELKHNGNFLAGNGAYQLYKPLVSRKWVLTINLWVKGDLFEHESAHPMGQWIGSAFEPKYKSHFLAGNGPYQLYKPLVSRKWVLTIDLWVIGEPFGHDESAQLMGQWVGSVFEPKYNGYFLQNQLYKPLVSRKWVFTIDLWVKL